LSSLLGNTNIASHRLAGRRAAAAEMRVPIRVQLGLLVLLTSMLGLMVLSVATWIYNRNFVIQIKSQGLTLTASLKAAQISSDLTLFETTCATVVTRASLQNALKAFYGGNMTDSVWTRAINDLQTALSSDGYSTFVQVSVFSRNSTGNPYGILNVTDLSAQPILLPYTYPNGSVSSRGTVHVFPANPPGRLSRRSRHRLPTHPVAKHHIRRNLNPGPERPNYEPDQSVRLARL
jgi:hypothetical protein